MKKLLFILILIPSICNAQIGGWFWSQLKNTSSPPPQTRQHLIFESTFTGINNWQATTLPVQIGSPWSNEQHCCSFSVGSAPASVIQCSQGAMAFTVRRNDPLTSGCVRSEVEGMGFSGNTDQWHAFNVMIPTTDVNDGTDQSMYQWHQQQASGVPAQAIWLTGGNQWLLSHNTSGAINNPMYQYNVLGNVVRGVWNTFVIHIRTAQNGTGLIQIWLNSSAAAAPTYSFTGNVGYPDGAYMKMGIYKFGWCTASGATTQRQAYYDQIRIGNASATYFDVAPGCY